MIGLVTLCYNEERFIKPFLEHLPDWIDKVVVLRSVKPWQGVDEPLDSTADIAREMGALVIENHWLTEEQQRNTGQDILADCDWVIILDPDEFLSDEGWENLHNLLTYPMTDAYVCERQRVFWKDKEVYPHTDYQQIILVRPTVRFVEKRVIDTSFGVAPVTLFHMSWARTDEECWSKISHYSHANEMDIEGWYKDVWLAGKTENLHPMTPETLKALIEPKLPPELERLKLLQ